MIGAKDFTTPVEIQKTKVKPKKKNYYLSFVIIAFMLIVMVLAFGKKQEKEVLKPYRFTGELVSEVNGKPSSINDEYGNAFTLFDTNTSKRYLNIEFYDSEYLAQKRYQRLNEINGYIREIDSSVEFENFLSHVQSPCFISEAYIDKNIVLIFDANTDKNIKTQFINTFHKLSKKYEVKPTNYEPLEIKELSSHIIKEQLVQVMHDADDKLAVQMMEGKVNLEALETDVVYLKNIPMFDDLYQRWNQYVEVLKTKSFEKSKLQKQLKEQLRKKVYKQGEYIVGEDMLAGYYIAVSTKHPQTEDVYQQYGWKQDTIFYLKDEQKVSISSSVVLYSLDNSPELNIEGYTSGVFKVGQHIEPGTYQLKAQSLSPCDYWIINDSELSDFIDRIANRYRNPKYKKVKNDQTETIHLNENQYLFLINGKLEKQ